MNIEKKLKKDAWNMEGEEKREIIDQKNILRLAENFPKLVKNNSHRFKIISAPKQHEYK